MSLNDQIDIKQVAIANHLSADSKQRISRLDDAIFWDTPVLYPYEESYWWIGTNLETNRDVCFAGLTVYDDHRFAYLARAGVRTSYRRQGLYTCLLNICIQFAQDKNLSHIITDTSTENYQSANALYNVGFRVYNPEWKWAGDASIYFSYEC